MYKSFADIKVKRIIYPGVVITIGFYKWTVDEPHSKIRIYLDKQKKEIVFNSL